MGVPLTFLKLAGAAALAGLAASQQQKSNAKIKRNLAGCTPCKAQLNLDRAKARVKRGYL